MLAALGSNLVIVKNGDGQVYWPAFYVNVIGNMLPGKGYLINLSSGQTFSFPANTANTAKSFVDIPESQHFILDKNTGSNMTLGMPERLWNDQLVYGSEIGVFSLGGQLVGTEVYTGSNLSVTIWGNDEHSGDSDGLLSGEEFHIRLWNPNTNIETDLVIKQWLTGDQRFKHNKISIADLCDVIQGNADIHLYQNIPNPFNGSTSIKYYLPDEMEIELSVLNVLGETIAILDAQNSQTGEHTHKFSKGILKAGTYYYRLATPNLIVTKKMVVLE